MSKPDEYSKIPCFCTVYCAAPILNGVQASCKRNPPEVPGCAIPYSHQGRELS